MNEKLIVRRCPDCSKKMKQISFNIGGDFICEACNTKWYFIKPLSFGDNVKTIPLRKIGREKILPGP